MNRKAEKLAEELKEEVTEDVGKCIKKMKEMREDKIFVGNIIKPTIELPLEFSIFLDKIWIEILRKNNFETLPVKLKDEVVNSNKRVYIVNPARYGPIQL